MLFRSLRALRPRRFLGAPLLGAALLFSQPGLAEDEPGDDRPIGAPPIEEDKPPQLVPYRWDHVGGHFQIGASGNLILPFGSVAKDVGTRTRSGPGGGFSGDIAYGLDRNVALGAYGELGWLGASNKCDGCSASTFGVGAFVRYHVSQGLKMDPWLSYGMGIVGYGADVGSSSLHYSGFDWMRLSFGANWFLNRTLIMGPVLSLNAGHMIERPQDEKVGGPIMRGIIGLRFAFDTPGRPRQR